MISSDLINTLRKDIEVIILKTEREFLNLPQKLLNERPDSKSWSILECFEHLNRYNRFYNTEVAKRLLSGGTLINNEIKSTWLGKKSIASMHPRNAKKQKTLKHLNPVGSSLTKETIIEFLKHQKHLLVLLDIASTNDLNKIKVPIEFFRLLKLTAAEALEFVVVHEQRHMIQLDRLLQFAKSREAEAVGK